MTLDELAAVSEDIRRVAFCQAILEAENGSLEVVVVFKGSSDPGITLTTAEVKPLAQQVQQRVIARLQARGVTIPGVGT